MIKLSEIGSIDEFKKYFDEYIKNPHSWSKEEIAIVKQLCKKFNVTERVLFMHGDDFRRKAEVESKHEG